MESYVPLLTLIEKAGFRRMRRLSILLWILLLAPAGFGASSAIFDASQNKWTLSNGWIKASFQLTPDGAFTTQQISDLKTGDTWTASPNRPTSPARLQTDSNLYAVRT